MSDATLDAHDGTQLLADCENEYCSALARVIQDDQAVQSLTQEELIYPLRHHHHDNLEVIISIHGCPICIRWGSGDLLFSHFTPPSAASMRTAIDPRKVYQDVVNGRAELVGVQCKQRGDTDGK